MTLKQQLVEEALSCTKQAVALLPPAPSGRLAARHPEVEREWRSLVQETAEHLAAAVCHDLYILSSAIRLADETGGNPRWRMLLEEAFAAAHCVAEGFADADLVDDTSTDVLCLRLLGDEPR